MLLAKGYPDIGWNPIEGERYLSFLRFAVFVNGMAAITIQSCSLCLSLSPSAKQVEKTSKGSAIFERPSVSSLRQGLPSEGFIIELQSVHILWLYNFLVCSHMILFFLPQARVWRRTQALS